jgi:hypothetical protein
MQKNIPINQSEAVLFSNITSAMVFTRQIFQITPEKQLKEITKNCTQKNTILKFSLKIEKLQY